MSTQSSLEPRIAQELIDTVIDFVHDDKKALRTFSLVCRGWVPRTRLHMFSGKVVITVWNCMRFIELLESPLLTFAHCVKQLELSGHVGDDPAAAPDPDQWLKDLSRHLHKFPLVESLALFHLDFSHIDLDVLKVLTELSPQLRELNIVCTTFPSYDSLISIFCQFPAGVPEVDIHKVITTENIFTPGKYLRAKDFNALTTDVNFPHQNHRRGFLSWLLSHERIPLTKGLYLLIYKPFPNDTAPFEDIISYMRACGDTLEVAKLRFPQTPSHHLAAELIPKIPLEVNHRLQKLVLSGGSDFKGLQFFHDVAWPLLCKVDSPELTKVAIIADELTYWVEEQYVDFTVSTAFFSRKSANARQDVHFMMYGYNVEEAKTFQGYVKTAIHELFEIEMAQPTSHLSFFDKIELHGQAQRENSLGYIQINPGLQGGLGVNEFDLSSALQELNPDDD